MNPAALIRKKRFGEALSKEELEKFVMGYVRGDIPEYQMSAFLMAVCFTGMTDEESTAFTEVMLHSGKVVDLSQIGGIKVDKHSTGGVGDKVSLILAPIVAACGVPVPMISGRGLGHTGGTLDKLESIPGFTTNLSIHEYTRIIKEIGLVLAGQTAEIAPADRKMYALRDVTSTVESIPLIAGSIMSKKLAEGIDALVLDVKTGNGAFMKRYDDAVMLASTLVGIGTRMGKKVTGYITDMSQPLGYAVGNWIEVCEAVECLQGRDIPDLMEVTYTLGGTMLHLGEKCETHGEGVALCREAVESGKAFEKFLRCVERQGGDTSVVKDRRKVAPAKIVHDVSTTSSGYLTEFSTTEIGLLAAELGAGRQRVDDQVDSSAGIIFKKKIGDPIARGESFATLYTHRETGVAELASRLQECITVEANAPPVPRRIYAVVDAEGTRALS